MSSQNDRAARVGPDGDGIRHDIGQDRRDPQSVTRPPLHVQILVKGHWVPWIPPLKRRKEWRRLPYGRFTCADGTEVLYNRGYFPIWARSPGGAVTAMTGDEWISNVVEQVWYYTDKNPPWREPATRRRCERVLREFGAPA